MSESTAGVLFPLPDYPPAPESTVGGLLRHLLTTGDLSSVDQLADALRDAERYAEVAGLYHNVGVILGHARGDRHLLAASALSGSADRRRHVADLWDTLRSCLISAFFLDLFDGSAAARLLSAELGDPREIAASIRAQNDRDLTPESIHNRNRIRARAARGRAPDAPAGSPPPG